jgi:hypothetical protein
MVDWEEVRVAAEKRGEDKIAKWLERQQKQQQLQLAKKAGVV